MADKMRLIDANRIVEVAERAYNAWNLANATADSKREINRVYKMMELCKAVRAVAMDCPTVDAVPVVHARWEPRADVPGFVRCSHCRDCNIYEDWPDGKKWNYCPNCGAKMDTQRRREPVREANMRHIRDFEDKQESGLLEED